MTSELFSVTLGRWATLVPAIKRGIAPSLDYSYSQAVARNRVIYIYTEDDATFMSYLVATGLPAAHARRVPHGNPLPTRTRHTVVIRTGQWWNREDRDAVDRNFAALEALVYDDYPE